ncbi:hypothetical protein [Undibacterium sp.]|uniref:hypothetical protein n=1 Tax=Undibacterium sp. TaxID=1914977 RepID=UPI0025D8898E|nr:hypothetical protein [Undibacterium sp.]
MNTLSSLASSHFLPQKMTDGLAAAKPSAQNRPAKLPLLAPASNHDMVNLSDTGVELARRANDLGMATIDMAQSLVNNFAKQLFGDAAKGMKISFDSASISTMAGFSASIQHSSGPGGSSDATAMSVQEASDFIGKGQITTADGHVYNFEVEVHYQAMAALSTSSSSNNGDNPRLNHDAGTPANEHAQAHQHHHTDGSQAPVATPPTAADLASQAPQNLRAHFPGSIQDLFSLLDDGKLQVAFQLPATGAGNQTPRSGNLTLRLLDLLKAPSLQAKKINDAYIDDAKQNNAKLETKPAAPDIVANTAATPS